MSNRTHSTFLAILMSVSFFVVSCGDINQFEEKQAKSEKSAGETQSSANSCNLIHENWYDPNDCENSSPEYVPGWDMWCETLPGFLSYEEKDDCPESQGM